MDRIGVRRLLEAIVALSLLPHTRWPRALHLTGHLGRDAILPEGHKGRWGEVREALELRLCSFQPRGLLLRLGLVGEGFHDRPTAGLCEHAFLERDLVHGAHVHPGLLFLLPSRSESDS